jgi:23S rRNA (guanosine2251-2'-O)-methyltransferase
MTHIVLIAHNLRSTHNVGSLLRTAEGLGVNKVVLSGYTPYPARDHDSRLQHLSQKIDKQISKTALGASNYIAWDQVDELEDVLKYLKREGFSIAAIEQAPGSQSLPSFKPPGKLVLILGREIEGIEPEILELCDTVLEIPMFGKKESFNVVQAAAMTLYHCRFYGSIRAA